METIFAISFSNSNLYFAIIFRIFHFSTLVLQLSLIWWLKGLRKTFERFKWSEFCTDKAHGENGYEFCSNWVRKWNLYTYTLFCFGFVAFWIYRFLTGIILIWTLGTHQLNMIHLWNQSHRPMKFSFMTLKATQGPVSLPIF